MIAEADNSSADSPEDPKLVVFRFALYSIEGILLVLFNSILVAAVLKYEALRHLKEFIVIAALALADALSGLGTLCAGLYRIPLILNGHASDLTSRRACFFTPQNLLWSLSSPAAGLMLLLVSVDRFICVAAPLKYLQQGRTYALMVISVVYGYSFVQFLVFALRAWSHTDLTEAKICMLGSALLPTDYSIWWYILTGSAMLSIVLYVAVIVVYRRRGVKVKPGDAIQLKLGLSRQQRLTKTLGTGCVCTFVFFGLPTMVGHVSYFWPELDYDKVVVWSWIISNINPLLNVFIYFYRQKEMKKAIRALMKCKDMPPNVNAWNTVVRKVPVKRETRF